MHKKEAAKKKWVTLQRYPFFFSYEVNKFKVNKYINLFYTGAT